MKKSLLTLALALAMLLAFAIPAFAAAGDSFDTAIQVELSDTSNARYTNGTFDEAGQSLYFVFKTEAAGTYICNSGNRPNIEFALYDAARTSIAVEDATRVLIELDANSTYYLKATSKNAENLTYGIMVVDRSDGIGEGLTPAGWVLLIGFILYLIILFFPYKKFLYNKYDFKLFGMPFKVAMIMVAAISGVAFIGGELGVAGLSADILEWWVLALAMAPGYIWMTILLFARSRNTIITVVNAILMLAFYIVMAYIVMALFLIAMLLIACMILFGALGTRGGGGGGSLGGIRKCVRCGMALSDTQVSCSCGMGNTR